MEKGLTELYIASHMNEPHCAACEDMGKRRLEAIVADGCAPVIMGAKAANLIALDKRSVGFGDAWLSRLRRLFAQRGISSCLLCACPKRCLVLFYHPDMLRRRLDSPDGRALLERFGYRREGLCGLLAQLGEKIEQGCQFPHEIGLFLGYPPKDVAAFIENGGKGELYCGYWKVYLDIDVALRSFELYDRCRVWIANMMKEGHCLSNILINGGRYNENVDNLLVGNG